MSPNNPPTIFLGPRYRRNNLQINAYSPPNIEEAILQQKQQRTAQLYQLRRQTN
jgi:hypothetical protein